MRQWMGLVSTLATLLCRPPAANLFVDAFIVSTQSLVPFSSTIASIVPGALARTVSGVSLYAALGNGNSERPNASFTSKISDMASSIFGKMGMSPKNPNIDQLLENMNVPSWESVRSQLEQQQTAEERQFRTNLLKGYGVGSPLHKVRLYDESNKEEDIRLTFYRDSASWCPYCQKVWIALEEKQIPYRVEKINMRCYGDKPIEFQLMQPSGQIPVAIIDGTVYRQSNDILQVLEDSFPHHKSLSASTGQEMQAQSLLRLERQLFSAWMYWLTSGSGSARNRESFLQVLQVVEESLSASDGPFFLGKEISIVDIQFTPFIERMAASLLYYKGFQMRVAPNAETKYPAINRWFDAMEQLPSYQLTKSDFYTHCWDLPPQLGGCVMESAGKLYESVINGERRLDDATKGSWELPLQPHNGGVEPDWAWAAEAAVHEAVERVSANHDAIVQFACRGAGTKGVPPVSAPLADPNAMSNAAVHGAVSVVLRIICLAMLDETSKKTQEVALVSLRQLIREQEGSDYTEGVVQSLAYLRDRVGVPRDMKLPAARQLRAHLNWAIGIIAIVD